tara:strand:+ start:6524 stop:6733 length:210 start_codon:yes stop_codon:yes gene_type:complete
MKKIIAKLKAKIESKAKKEADKRNKEIMDVDLGYRPFAGTAKMNEGGRAKMAKCRDGLAMRGKTKGIVT